MKPYRPSCDLSGYTPINESIYTTFSVISEKSCIFAPSNSEVQKGVGRKT